MPLLTDYDNRHVTMIPKLTLPAPPPLFQLLTALITYFDLFAPRLASQAHLLHASALFHPPTRFLTIDEPVSPKSLRIAQMHSRRLHAKRVLVPLLMHYNATTGVMGLIFLHRLASALHQEFMVKISDFDFLDLIIKYSYYFNYLIVINFLNHQYFLFH